MDAVQFDQIHELVKPNDSKMILLVLDGLGGLPNGSDQLTALEAANTPHMDQLTAEGICGTHVPVAPGITPGSGPSHLGLFGYDPVIYQVGRGVLSALGIDFDLEEGDIAARGNFCTVDQSGKVKDRRAGRISSEMNRELLSLLQEIKLEGADVILRTIKEYRFLLVLRGKNPSAEIGDTDPQKVGVAPLKPRPLNSEAEFTTRLVQDFIDQAGQILKHRDKANMVLLRGFSKKPDWPKFSNIYGVKGAAIAEYPMYRGVASLVGMDALEKAESIEEELKILRDRWDDYDFFFLHIKRIDSYGEDGDFENKKSLIEKVDSLIPVIKTLEPEVILITGDHSTPVKLKSHSWHPVPVLLWSPQCRPDEVTSFGERSCIQGALGPRIPSTHLMPLIFANARRLKKYGA
jgi:2,3-bisphosphoglycerate-independent phosphoglycerate mutase